MREPVRRVLWLVPLVASLGLLGGHAATSRARPLWDMEYAEWVDGQRYSMATWRYWEDVKFAIGRYLDWRYGPQGGRRADAERAAWGDSVDSQPELTKAYRGVVEGQARSLEIRPHQFWRTLPDRPFLRERKPYLVPPLEDPGRSVLAWAGFVLLGGVSPFLVIWLATLVAIPTLAWLWFELKRAGHVLAGSVLLASFAASPFVAQTLTLPHSAVGFYLVGLFLAVTLAVYAVLSPCRSRPLFWTRVGLGGLVFALCAICRSGTILLLPGLVVILLLAVRRVFGAAALPGGGTAGRASSRRVVLQTISAVLVFVAPYLFLKPEQRHAAWLGLWEGLGDFAADRGYSWHDRDAKRFMQRHGLRPFEHPNEVLRSHEAFFRDRFLGDVARDPLWYAGVLLRRTMATVTQAKLWPTAWWGGRSVREPIFHYKYVTPVDWFGWGHAALEIPCALALIPTGILAVAGLAWGPGTDPRSRQSRRFLLVMALTAVCALPLPVLVSTAAAVETQAFAVVFLLGLAFLGQSIFDARARVRRSAIG